MDLKSHIEEIRSGIKAGHFRNEASVSHGIVLRLLDALSWPRYDTQVVYPEYSLGARRVDFALCHPPGRPIAFIEVKQTTFRRGWQWQAEQKIRMLKPPRPGGGKQRAPVRDTVEAAWRLA